MNGDRVSFAYMNIAPDIPDLTNLIFHDFEPRMMYLSISMTNIRHGFSKLGVM